MNKKCPNCKKNPKRKDGLCAACKQAYQAKWRRKNRETIREKQREWRSRNKIRVRNYSRRWVAQNKDRIAIWKKKNRHRLKSHYLNYRYGIKLSEARKMLASQGGICSICLKRLTSSTMKVDHCHKTGKVRGILCHGCNIALGLMKESAFAIRRLLQYAESHK